MLPTECRRLGLVSRFTRQYVVRFSLTTRPEDAASGAQCAHGNTVRPESRGTPPPSCDVRNDTASGRSVGPLLSKDGAMYMSRTAPCCPCQAVRKLSLITRLGESCANAQSCATSQINKHHRVLTLDVVLLYATPRAALTRDSRTALQ
ncbi:hypothetical protein NDU88_003300 [Pleurodeles waltl]|uniref:Uncharacterized protein n=1 Tax=Pleurodeles waltl TaxID=8319 RepID=A0AAV7RCI1_PLEWA|nr:hypothetical protein NDU88_003300 [Pleurodeles waltl]